MREEDFDAAMQRRPFVAADMRRVEAEIGRSVALGALLWGAKAEKLRNQLLRASPDIPAGFELADYRKLEQHLRIISGASGDSRFAWLPARWAHAAPTIFVGSERYTEWEARSEIVRRAIEYLERH